MALISVDHVSKAFKIPKVQPGLTGSIKSLFHREYDVRQAVDDMSFALEAGEMVGYIGPNGAGKSTTIKMLSGVLIPDSGDILVDGLKPYENRSENARNIGVVFGQRSQLYWDLPVSDTFDIFKKIYSIPDDIFNSNRKLFIELLDMSEIMDQPARQLSLGQKMKANLALSMLHNPRVLYLDEPTIGLDIVTKRRLRACIKEINSRLGTTIILTTHDMDDIEEICQRIILIDRGRKLFDGAIREFKDMYASGARYRLEFDELPTWQPHEGWSLTAGESCWIVHTEQPYSKEALITLIEQYAPRNIYSEEITIEDMIYRLFERRDQ